MREAVTASRTIGDYEGVTPAERLSRLRSVGGALGDRRVLHVNSTDSGGGVAELLRSLVPLLNDLGIETDWLVLEAPEAFFEVTKALHNRLQGDDVALTDDMLETYREWTDRNAAALESTYDVVVLHDPQTLGMAPNLAERFPDATLVWRCHVDLTSAAETDLEFVQGYVDRVDRAVFSREEYASDLAVARTVIHPSIDPLSAKNRPLDDPDGVAAELPFPAGGDAPLLVQVSRFDPWKDPVGVVDAYRRVREESPDAVLALAGGMADDDPEAVEVYRRVEAETADDPGVYLLPNCSDEVVNLLQRRADVVVQKSLREGFALTVSEALWKATPVVGADVGGIPLQIRDGHNGYLVDPEDTAAVADRAGRLLDDPNLADEFGRNGRETVRDRFLLPRHLLDYLGLFADLVGAGNGADPGDG